MLKNIMKILVATAIVPFLSVTATEPAFAGGLSDAIESHFRPAPRPKPAHNRLTKAEHKQLDAWLEKADGKGLVQVDHGNPDDLRGLDLLRRLAGYQPRSDYLKARSKIDRKTLAADQLNNDVTCKDFLAKYQANGLYLDLGQRDGKMMATALQANARADMPAVKYANVIAIIGSDKKLVTNGDGLANDKPMLVTYAPPKPGVYDKAHPPRAVVEYTVFKEDGTPCSYREVRSVMPWPESINVTAPNNTRPNSKTVLCLNRKNPDGGWPDSCDYGPFTKAKRDTGWAVIVPQQGEIVLPGKVALKPDGTVDADLQVTAINSKNGVTCTGQDVDAGKTVLATATVDPRTGRSVKWSLLGEQAPTFGQTCYEAHTGLAFNMFWNIRMISGGVSQTVTAIVSNTLTQGSYNTQIVPNVDLQFGCLPASTKVTLANGDSEAIERIGKGDLVRGADGKPWQVWSRMVGEDLSLVRIVAADGTEVRTSDTHPVIIGYGADGRPRAVPAVDLRAGMPLVTTTGTSTVVSAVTVPYDGPVYNLAIHPAGDEGATAQGGAFYADGMLVGDQTMQGLISPAPVQAGSTPEIPG